ncbi:MAG: response regulator [Acidobacteriota bacterium]
MPAHHLLLIDTSAQTLKLLKHALEAKNYTVSIASDIHKAFELIRKHPLSLIITNTRLPELMPFEIFYQLLEAAGTQLPIIALSDSDTDQERAIAKEAGFAGFVTKPIQIRGLLAAIKSALQGRRAPERGETRREIGIDVLIHILDHRGRIIDTERTITENLSRRGACLLTLNSLDVGDTISVVTIDNAFQSRAIVRGTYLGPDRIRRINIEFIDEKWQDEWLINND